MLKKIMSKLNKDSISIGVAVVAIVVVGFLVLAGSNPTVNKVLSGLNLNLGMSAETIAKNSIDYLNNSVLNGQTATLIDYSQESGLVKINIKIGEATYESYATRDGKLLFPEALKIGSGAPVQANANQTAEPTNVKPADVKKVANSSLDVFVVSRCPFGLQIQRAVAEAVKTIPSLADAIKIKYIGGVSGNTITAMHGDAEAQENLRQICIRDEQKDKYWPYVACQMKSSGAADGCLASTGVNMSQLNSCISDTARGVAYAKADFAVSDKFNVQGSPTLILNEQQISEFDFGGRSAEVMKKIICDSSETAPAYCGTQLNTADAATSFSATYSTDSSSAPTTVASANTGANCAPAQ